jgi:hypothetical protein
MNTPADTAGVAPSDAPSNLDLSQRLMQFRNAHWTHWTAGENQLVVDCFHALRRTLVGVDAPREGQPVYIQKDHLQKAMRAPFLCRVTTEPAPDRVRIIVAPAGVKTPLEGRDG